MTVVPLSNLCQPPSHIFYHFLTCKSREVANVTTSRIFDILRFIQHTQPGYFRSGDPSDNASQIVLRCRREWTPRVFHMLSCLNDSLRLSMMQQGSNGIWNDMSAISTFELCDFQMLSIWPSREWSETSGHFAATSSASFRLKRRFNGETSTTFNEATPARDGSDQTGIAKRCQGEIGKNHLGLKRCKHQNWIFKICTTAAYTALYSMIVIDNKQT